MSIDEFLRYMQASPLHRTFYHFTDTRNLPLIQEHGILSRKRMERAKIDIPAPGGNNWSMEADARAGMDEYVHLCFKTDNAMEYVARRDGRIKEVIYLQIRPDVIKLPGAQITTDVANKAGVVPGPVLEMLSTLDHQVLYRRTDWHDETIKERLKAADKCEILIPNHVPLPYILNVNG